jgi:hypothetical protein
VWCGGLRRRRDAQVLRSFGLSYDQIMIYFLCTGFGLIFLKATGMWDNMMDNLYRLVRAWAPSLAGLVADLAARPT